MINKLFTYGSLNDINNEFSKLLLKNSKYIGEATINGVLYNIGEYPGIILSDYKNNTVFGKLFEITDLSIFEKIDKYEEYYPKYPNFSLFIRKKSKVISNESIYNAWVYVYNKSIENKELIKSGDYKKYLNK